MGFGAWLFGSAVGEVAKPVEAVGNALDQLFTSDDERAAAKIVMEKLEQAPGILQQELNKIQAAHPSVFVAGPRPFIMWVCGLAFALHFLAFPVANFALAVLGWQQIAVVFDMDTLMTTLFGILGLGAFRTAEKIRGVAR